MHLQGNMQCNYHVSDVTTHGIITGPSSISSSAHPQTFAIASSATSALCYGQLQIAYSEIREVRVAPRAFGGWGDMVIFLKKGGTLELVGMQQYQQIKVRQMQCIAADHHMMPAAC
jgi:hypothetical protein